MKARTALWALIFLTMATLSCNLTRHRPTQPPSTVGPGSMVNPYLRIQMDEVTAVHVYASSAHTGTLTGEALNNLEVALNVSVQVEARNVTCPDHVRLVFIRQDASQFELGVCLNGVVVLRGLPGAESFDAPLYGAASDALSPYLPDELNALLDF